MPAILENDSLNYSALRLVFAQGSLCLCDHRLRRIDFRSRPARHVEKLVRMTPEEANRRLSLTPPAGCRNSFSSCNDGKATNDDLYRKDWDGSSPLGPGGSSPTVLPSRRGALLDVDRGSLLDADQHRLSG